MKKLVDRIQVWLYLSGFPRLARFVGLWGSAPLLSAGAPFDERPTLPDPVPPEHVGPVRSGPGWSLDEFEVGPLKIVNFDPTFNNNPGIDVSRDIAVANSKLDVN